MLYGLGLVNAIASHRHEPEHVVMRPLIKAATPRLRFFLDCRASAHICAIVCCFFLALSLEYSGYPIVDTALIQLQKIKQNTQMNKPAVTCEDETATGLTGPQGWLGGSYSQRPWRNTQFSVSRVPQLLPQGGKGDSSSPPSPLGLAISYKMELLCNWWEGRRKDGNWQTETQEETVVKTGSWVRRKLRKTAGRSHLGTPWLQQLEQEPLGDGYLVKRCLHSASENHQFWCHKNCRKIETRRVSWQLI